MGIDTQLGTEQPVASPRRLNVRRFYRAAAGYGLVAWLAVQVADVLFPVLFLPDWSVRLVVAIAVAGLPIALVFAWATTGRESEAGDDDEAHHGWRPAAYLGAGALLTVLAAALYIQAVSDGARPELSVRSVAVLPFVDLSVQGDGEYFADGVAGEILNSLARIEGLRVAARTSSFAFRDATDDVRDIGRRLNVGALVEGTVRREGDQVRISVQLIDVEDGFNRWSETYSRRLDDILDIQQEIAARIVDAMRPELLGDASAMGEPATRDAAAWQLYAEGRHAFHRRTPDSLERAIDLFQAAVARDPGYALAWSGLADAWLLSISYGNVDTDRAKQRAAAAIGRALAADERLAEANASLGLLHSYSGDVQLAERAFRRALDLNPNYAMAHMWLGGALREQGRLRASYEEYRRAREVDPLHPVINANIASSLLSMGRYEAGMDTLALALEMAPDAASVHREMSWWSGQYGRLDEALRSARAAQEMEAEAPLNLLALSRAHLWLGDVAAADDWLSRAERTSPDNMKVFWYRASFYRDTGQHAVMDAYARARLAIEPPPGQGTLAYDDRMRLSLAGMGRLLVHDYDHAVQLLERAVADRGPAGAGMDHIEPMLYLAVAYRRSARFDEADAVVAECAAILEAARDEGHAGPRFVVREAAVDALAGDVTSALAHLEAAVEQGWRQYGAIEGHPAFASIAPDTRFRELVARMRADVRIQRERTARFGVPAATKGLSSEQVAETTD